MVGYGLTKRLLRSLGAAARSPGRHTRRTFPGHGVPRGLGRNAPWALLVQQWRPYSCSAPVWLVGAAEPGRGAGAEEPSDTWWRVPVSTAETRAPGRGLSLPVRSADAHALRCALPTLPDVAELLLLMLAA